MRHRRTHGYHRHLPAPLLQLRLHHIVELRVLGILHRISTALLGRGIVVENDVVVPSALRFVVTAPVAAEGTQLALVLHEHRAEHHKALHAVHAVGLTRTHGGDVRVVVEGNAQRLGRQYVGIERAVLDLGRLVQVHRLVFHLALHPTLVMRLHELLGVLVVHGIGLVVLSRRIAMHIDVEVGIVAVLRHTLAHTEDLDVEHHLRHVTLHFTEEALAKNGCILQ